MSRAELASRACDDARPVGERKCTLVPHGSLRGVAAVPPEAPDRPGEHQRPLAVTALARVRQRNPDVVVLQLERVVPALLLRAGQLWLGFRDQIETQRQVVIPEGLELIALLEQLARELADRREHEEASVADRLEEV